MTVTDPRGLTQFTVTGTDTEDDVDDEVRHIDMPTRDSSKWYWEGTDKKYTKQQILKIIGKKYQGDKKFASKEAVETAFGYEIEKIANLQRYSSVFHFQLCSEGIPEEGKETDPRFNFKINDKGPYSITWTCGVRYAKSIGLLIHVPIIEHFKSQGYPITRAR